MLDTEDGGGVLATAGREEVERLGGVWMVDLLSVDAAAFIDAAGAKRFAVVLGVAERA
nr:MULTISPECIES: hypothetical protein [Frankia]